MLASRLKGAFLKGGVGGMSPEYCRFRSMLSRSHYLISLLVYHTQKTPLELEKKISSGEHPRGALTINHLVILAGVTLKLEKLAKLFSSFNPCPSLPTLAMRKTVAMAKYRLGYCFSHVIDGTTRFSFLKRSSKKRDIAIVIK